MKGKLTLFKLFLCQFLNGYLEKLPEFSNKKRKKYFYKLQVFAARL